MSDPTNPPRAPAVPAPKEARACPVCGRPITADMAAAARVRPFCSRACADVDLLRWLRGGYVVAGPDADEDEDGEAGRGGSATDDTPEGSGRGAA